MPRNNNLVKKNNVSSSFFSNLLTGFSFGSGSSIAHTIFGLVSNNSSSEKEEMCKNLTQEYTECVKKNYSFNCTEIKDLLKEKC